MNLSPCFVYIAAVIYTVLLRVLSMSILSISSMSLPVVILEFPEPHAVQKHNMHWVFEAPLCNLKLEFSHQCSIFKYTQCTLIVFIILAKKRSLNVFHLFLKIIIFFLLLLLLDDVLFTVFPTFITVFLSVFHLYKGYLQGVPEKMVHSDF